MHVCFGEIEKTFLWIIFRPHLSCFSHLAWPRCLQERLFCPVPVALLISSGLTAATGFTTGYRPIFIGYLMKVSIIVLSEIIIIIFEYYTSFRMLQLHKQLIIIGLTCFI